MKELNNFREFLYEVKFKIGDTVTMKGGGEDMEIIKTRRMFGSNVNAYTVKNVGGDEYEYDESQLKLAEGILNESAPGYDTRKQGEPLPTLESVRAAYEAKKEVKETSETDVVNKGMQDLIDIIVDNQIDPMDALEAIGQEFEIAFEFGRG